MSVGIAGRSGLLAGFALRCPRMVQGHLYRRVFQIGPLSLRLTVQTEDLTRIRSLPHRSNDKASWGRNLTLRHQPMEHSRVTDSSITSTPQGAAMAEHVSCHSTNSLSHERMWEYLITFMQSRSKSFNPKTKTH